MKVLVSIIVVAVLIFAGNSVFARENGTDWDAFGKNLVKGIESGNEGVQQAAMRHIILYDQLYPGKLDVADGVWNIMKIFRTHKNPRVRKLAMLALFCIGDERAIYVLKRNMKFEQDEGINKQCCCLLRAFYAEEGKKRQKKAETLFATSDN